MAVESFGELHNMKAFQIPKPRDLEEYLIEVIPQTFDVWNK